MAKYGSSRYGSGFKYGEVSAVSVYYSSEIYAYTTAYDTTTIKWNKFATDPADGTITYWKLVKSYTGSLDNPDDAEYVTGGAYASFATSYVDTLFESFGKEINYSLWVFNGLTWINCGNSYVISAVDDGTLTTVARWLPRTWLNYNTDNIGDATGEVESNDLSNTLSTFALTYDIFRSEANLLQLSSNQSYTPNAILGAKILDYGFSYEPTLGDSYHRSLVGVSNIVYSYKGTETSIKTYTTGLTHWQSDVKPGHNLMLDYNDSSFEESIGRWAASSGTLEPKTFLGESLSAPAATDVLYDTTILPKLVGFAQLTTTATTAVTLRLPSSGSDVTLYGVSVKSNTRYLFSGWALHRDANAATVTATISWYNAFGTLISTTSAGPTLTTTTAWKEFRSISTSGRNGQLSPTNAAFATITITVTPSSATSSRFAFDLFQFAEAANSFEYQDAKLIQQYVSGDKVNYVPNPSFESGLGSWSAYNGSLHLDTTSTLGLTFRSTASPDISSAILTATNGGAAYVSDWIPVDPGQTITASAYVMGSATRQAAIKLEFSSQATSDIQTEILNSPTYGQYYPTTINETISSFNTTEITDVTSDGTTITYTAANSFIAGQTVTIKEVDPPEFNLTGVTIASATSSQFTVTNSALGTYSEGGNASVSSTTLSTTLGKQISVTAIAPPYEKDSGYPLAKIIVYFPNSVNADKFYLDGVLLENSTSASPYFGGTGGIVPSNPTTSNFYSVNDTKWETKNKFNFASNPSFEVGTLGAAPTDWASTGTITKVATDASLNPLYNTHFAKVAFTTSTTVTGNYYLPNTALGGEDITISAYVRAPAAATYTIGSSTFVVPAASNNIWVRIHTTIQAASAATSGTISIAIASTTATYFHIDGVQVEYGRVVSKFVDPLDSQTATFTNPINAAKTYIASQTESNGGGKSTWFYNYGVKVSRLKESLGRYIALGSSWTIKPGFPTESYRDLTESLIPSNSFETSIGGWTTTSANTTLTRYVAKGNIFSDTVTHGQAYCGVAYSATSTTTPYNIKSEKIYLKPDGGYYASVALRPRTSSSLGDTYTLRVDFYDSNDAVIPVYTDNITGQYTSSKYDSLEVINTVVSTTAARTASRVINYLDRWSYLAKTFAVGTIQGAAYAILTVTVTPISAVTAKGFDIDRVTFRQ
jgi:hypothetical protein